MTTLHTYYIHYFNERTATGGHTQVEATTPDEAMVIVERSLAGVADYTTAQVSLDPYGIDVVAEYGDLE